MVAAVIARRVALAALAAALGWAITSARDKRRSQRNEELSRQSQATEPPQHQQQDVVDQATASSRTTILRFWLMSYILAFVLMGALATIGYSCMLLFTAAGGTYTVGILSFIFGSYVWSACKCVAGESAAEEKSKPEACHACGHPLPNDARFCPNCGARRKPADGGEK
mmetsp:Transcript_76614/g.177757  ORF Transcript_76614/g.177757 Transcript_76614/m.177757 type:complete len:168 (-) Transcript_76614:83-586(-)